MKKHKLCLLVSVLCLMFSACSSDNPTTEQLLVGRWEMDKLVIDGVEHDYHGGKYPEEALLCGRDFYELKNNKTYIYYTYDRKNTCNLDWIPYPCNYIVIENTIDKSKTVEFYPPPGMSSFPEDGAVFHSFKILYLDQNNLKMIEDDGVTNYTYVLKKKK